MSLFQNRVFVPTIVSVMEENYINRPVIAPGSDGTTERFQWPDYF